MAGHPVTIYDQYGKAISSANALPVQLTGSNAIYTGEVTVGQTLVNLPAQAGSEVLLQASPNNASTISVGNATAQPIILSAGQSISLQITNLDLISVIAGQASQSLGWVVRS